MELATKQQIEAISAKEIDLALRRGELKKTINTTSDMPVIDIFEIVLVLLTFIKQNMIKDGKVKFPSLLKIGTYVKAVRLIGTIALKLIKIF